VARQVPRTLPKHKDLRDIIAILGRDEIPEEDKLVVVSSRAPPDEEGLELLGTDHSDLQSLRGYPLRACGASIGYTVLGRSGDTPRETRNCKAKPGDFGRSRKT